jgi:hypothetical protein
LSCGNVVQAKHWRAQRVGRPAGTRVLRREAREAGGSLDVRRRRPYTADAMQFGVQVGMILVEGDKLLRNVAE